MELKKYQGEAVETAVDIFDSVRQRLDETEDEAQRRTITSHDGCILLEAPTGAGKTVIAGNIAQEMSRRDRIVWFWFAPFAGLVEQSEGTIRRQFPELRIRDLLRDRQIEHVRAGDVFVATWAAVATNNKAARRVRQKSETSRSLDDLLDLLRERNVRIGVIVDEAHHSFSGTETAAFYRDVLRPDYTLLVTATPGDTDAEAFRRKVGIARLQRLSVSRHDAVESGLIKRGIKCAAYFAMPHLETLVDYEMQALRDGWEIHQRIKSELVEAGVLLTPLMLVQIESKGDGDDESRVRTKLEQLGVPSAAIATHTAKEPDADVLSLAYDESKEVLIFKMAVALGFDAPRAFTLVSMRGAKDEDFGVQIVGRILRIHPKLQNLKFQNRAIPEPLQWGYVILANAESQSGLMDAGKRINAVQTNLSSAGPVSIIMRVGDEKKVHIIRNGQPTLEAMWSDAPILPAPDAVIPSELEPGQLPINDQLTMADIMTGTKTALKKNFERASDQAIADFTRTAFNYPLRPDAPRVLRSHFLPEDPESLHESVAGLMKIDDAVLSDARRSSVDLTRDVREMFDQVPPELQRVRGRLSMQDVEVRAEQLLLKLKFLNAQSIQDALLRRLQREFEMRGQTDISDDEDKLEKALALILVLHKHLLEDAQRIALRAHCTVRDAKPLPESLNNDEPLEPSLRNIYGVFPPGLNNWERPFAELLDRDSNNVVLWWHRNPSQKSYSTRVYLINGEGFYPDFAIGVRGREQHNNIILLDTKGQINEDKAVLEAAAEHPEYGRIMLTCWENKTRWRIVEPPRTGGRSVLGKDFDTQWLVDF